MARQSHKQNVRTVGTGQRLSLYHVALTAVIVVLIGYLLVHGAIIPPMRSSGGDPAERALATGEVANFTLAFPPKPALDVSFTDVDDRRVTFADFKGKVVLLNFWATWCAPCVREMPSLARLAAELGSSDFAVVALSSDRQGLPIVREFFLKHSIEGPPIYVDPSNVVPRKFQAIGIPTTVLLDRDGRELGRLVGPAEWDSAAAKKLLRYFIAKGPS